MFTIRYVSEHDRSFWFSLDSHLNESEFYLKIRDKKGYIICDDNNPIGVMRYNLFWDNIPFLTFIYFDENYRGKGFGKQAVLYWENEMRNSGHEMVMTSTQVDEKAQHFYRKLGYMDRGCLVLDNTPFEQPQELFMIKILSAKVRVMHESDYECLPEFLYHAIFIPEGIEPPSRSIIHSPEIFVYIKDFGTQPGDLGVVAEQNGQVVGAAWTRIIPAFGHINDKIPELAISILPEFRGHGIGTMLMKKLFEVLREHGYKQTSLSVQKDNPAVRFYQRLGYERTGERPDHAGHEDFLMIKKL